MNAGLLAIELLSAHGDSVRLRPTGTGTGDVLVSAGEVTKTLRVTVADTVYSIVVSPASATLVAGDTITFVATVDGPIGASRLLDWEPKNTAVLRSLPTLDSLSIRVQATAAGSVSLRAIALADTTKVGTATVAAQLGKLAFIAQPSTAEREVPFHPVVAVEVQNAAGTRSMRAANVITLSPTAACGAFLHGGASVNATNGVASFPKAALDARCAATQLSASASPPAAPAVSQVFAVNARSCASEVPLIPTPVGEPADTNSAIVESVDCVVTRGSRSFYAHIYTVTVPISAASPAIEVIAASVALAPRVESYLWSQDPEVFWADSVTAPGALRNAYGLPPGVHRFIVTTAAPGGTGSYALFATTLALGAGPRCRMITAPGATLTDMAALAGNCERSFASRADRSIGREFLLYLRPGKSIQVRQERQSLLDIDPYLEVFDVTTDTTLTADNLIAYDDNSGGGVRGNDALVTVTPAPIGRFIVVRATRLGGTNNFFNLIISP